jgi:ribosome-associated translation inhibitor RaiA
MHPIQIVFRGVKPSESVEGRIQARFARLRRIERRLTSCHVVVQAAHRRQHQGNPFDVRLQVRFPGGEIDINADGGPSHLHEDVHLAIADTFDAAERQLLRKLRKQHISRDTGGSFA